MNLYNKIQAIGEGNFKIGWFGGWLDIEFEEDTHAVMWTSHEDEHYPLMSAHRAVIIDVTLDEVTDVYEAILTLWRVNDKTKQNKIVALMTKRIDKVYKKRVGKLGSDT